MPANIYDQHRASFAQVSAYVVVHNGERVATVALKFPRDGAGRLLAYVHWLGEPMVRGYAGGYGYDKSNAAVANAARKLTLSQGLWPDGSYHYNPETVALHALFCDMLSRDDGVNWDDRLRDAGFKVWSAV
jgi:hypothetical protein